MLGCRASEVIVAHAQLDGAEWQGCTLPTSLEACHDSCHSANEDRHMVCKRLTPWIRS